MKTTEVKPRSYWARRRAADAANQSRRELAAILAGLRLVQLAMERRGGMLRAGDDVYEILTDGDNLDPLTVEEINSLCERLNTGHAWDTFVEYRRLI